MAKRKKYAWKGTNKKEGTNQMKCQICNSDDVHRSLELRGMEDIDVCQDCENEVMDFDLVFYNKKFHDFSELGESQKVEIIKEYLGRILKDIVGLKYSIDTDEIINFTKAKIEQRHRKYMPLVNEMRKYVNQEQAKYIIELYQKNGETGLTKINELTKLRDFIKNAGLTFYETIHCLSEIAKS